MKKLIAVILEYKSSPGHYYCDNQWWYTMDPFVAERYNSSEEALRYMNNPNDWNIKKIFIE